jgi:hypothetical protein
MSSKDERLMKIEQSILGKIEKKNKKITDKFTEKIDKAIKELKDSPSAEKAEKLKIHEKAILREQRKLEKLRSKEAKRKRQRDKYNLTPHQEYELRKHKAKSGFMSHFVSFASVNVMLIVIWFITGGYAGLHPWFIYPLLGWAIGLASHYIGYKGHLKKLDIIYANRDEYFQDSFQLQDEEPSQIEKADEEREQIPERLIEPYSSYVNETKQVSNTLLKQINESDNVDKELLKQIKDSLNHYTDKIFYLSKRGHFLEQAINQFDLKNVEESKESIEKLLQDAELDDDTKKEYENALRMLDKQATSLGKVQKVKDKIQANLNTSLITLNTLKLDFIRLQYITDESAEDAIQSLNKKTEEIDDYIDLLSDSLKDIDNQI